MIKNGRYFWINNPRSAFKIVDGTEPKYCRREYLDYISGSVPRIGEFNSDTGPVTNLYELLFAQKVSKL